MKIVPIAVRFVLHSFPIQVNKWSNRAKGTTQRMRVNSLKRGSIIRVEHACFTVTIQPLEDRHFAGSQIGIIKRVDKVNFTTVR